MVLINQNITLGLLALFFVGLTATLRSADAQTVIACGGFVKGPDNIDFSRIEVRLFTVDGILKYQSFCAPHNGYFTVPVYNNGDYILKLLPPAGWTFNPSQFALKIDSKTDPCSKQEDINFSFAGFQVTGKVLSAGSELGPEGLRLELQGENAADVKIAQTGADGGYSFESVLPGKYKLVAVHLTWRFRQNNIPIIVTKENIVAPTILVTGYDLAGSVVSDTGPASGVQLTLFAPEKADIISECKSDFAKTTPINGFKPVCAVLSDPVGFFSFPPLPPGSYRLVPSFQNSRTRFSVVPPSRDLTISNSSVTIKEPFVVSGFSISGRVVFPSGYPAKDVVVMLNNKPVAKTGEDGIYVIEELKSGSIKLSFTADSAEFLPLSGVVTADSTTLADVFASKIAACGLIVGESGFDNNIEVAAKNAKTGAVSKLTVQTKKSRQFCFMLEPGDYLVSVENPTSIFRPRQLNIALKAGPHFGASFEAFIATASGRVHCLEKDCTGIFLTLFQQHEHSDQLPTAIAELKTTKTGEFQFRNLHPGQYLLQAVRAPFCFAPAEGLAFAIDDKDVTGLEVKQTGYSLTLNAAHPIRLGFKHVEKQDVFIAAEVRPPDQPSVTICLPQPGHYKVTHEKFLDRENDWGCYFFSGSYPTELDTSNLPRELNPVALLHLVTINVQTTVQVPLEELYVGIRYIENATFHNQISGKSEDATSNFGIEEEIAAYNKQKASRQPITTPLRRRDRLYFGEDQVKKNPDGTYSHSSAIFWYATQIALEPKHPRLIFKPKMVEFTLDQDSVQCPAFAASFLGVEAYVLRGYISPPTPGVRVTLTNRRNPDEVHVVWTESDGSYSLGPLDPGDSFEAAASIDGWEIHQVANQPGNFSAKRLGSIEITVVDAAGNVLEGALISISGPGHFRNNSLTSKDGIVYLGSLAGGQYYAQGFRKEYAFEPRNVLIPLKSGEAATIKFIGKRVAYSCFGQVVTLNDEPEQGLFVIARSTDCENAPGEEAETDAKGNFRILGLFPQCTYSITLRPIPQLERTVPKSALVYIKDVDVVGVKIWAVRAPLQQLLITARLDGPSEFLNVLQVSLLNVTSGLTLNVITPTSLLLAFPPLPAQSVTSAYALKMEPLASFASNMYFLQTEPVSLQLDESGFIHAVIKFDVKRRSERSDHESPIASLLQVRSLVSLLIAVFVIVITGGIYFYASADKNTKQATIEGARSLLSNPTGFMKSRFNKQRASSPTTGRSERVAAVRQAAPKQQQQQVPASGEKSSSEELPSEEVQGTTSSSEGSSTESSSPERATEATAASEQPRKRVQARTRIQ